MREPDILDLAAREHRELQRALRRIVREEGDSPDAVLPPAILEIAADIARHEAIDRLLLYPIIGRDGYGRRSLVDRRAEQRSISDQLLKVSRTAEENDGDVLTVLSGLKLTFVGHSDREEIEDFPHARRLSSRDERRDLAELRRRLTQELTAQMPTLSLPSGSSEADRIGPVQSAIAASKEILIDLDRSRVPAH